MSNDSSSGSGGVSLFAMVFVAFLVLKLCRVIDWSWWWVTAPLWGGAALGVMVLLVMALGWLLVWWWRR